MKRILATSLSLAMLILLAGMSQAETLTIKSDSSVQYLNGSDWVPAIETYVDPAWGSIAITGAKWVWRQYERETIPITITSFIHFL